MLTDVAIYLTVSPLVAGTLCIGFLAGWLRRQRHDQSGGKPSPRPVAATAIKPPLLKGKLTSR